MRLPITGMIMICMAGIMFFLFIGFSYAFNGEHGLKHSLWESANHTMSGDQLNKFNDLMPQLTQGFGIVGVMCVAIAIIIFVVDAFGGIGGPPREGYY